MGIVIVGYLVSIEAGVKNAALLVAVGGAITAYIVSKPAWLIVERVPALAYGNAPLVGISPAESESYASLVQALRRADDAYLANANNSGTLSRISKNEANKILGFLRSQNRERDGSSKRFYVEYDGRAYQAILQFQYERPKLVD